MKISLKLPNGATLEFDGDAAEFERVTEFLAEPPDSFQGRGVGKPTVNSNGEDEPEENGEDDQPRLIGAIDPRAVDTRLNMVGARTDIERVTVMAQMAMEAGMQGIDYKTIDRLYVDLGFRKPPRFAKTFSNAKQRNLVRSVSQGVWRPTIPGENYARGLGKGRGVTAPPRERVQPSDEEGGNDD